MEERRNPNSKWRSYIELLPSDWSSFPVFYSDEDMQMLRGSDIVREILLAKEQLSASYDILASNIPRFEIQFSLEEFSGAYRAI